MPKKTSHRLDLTVQYACRREGLPSPADFRRWARAALSGGGQVTIRLAGLQEARQLNAHYRGKDYATNVLSFPYETGPRLEGDLVLCPEVVASEAAEQKKPQHVHYAHLVVHGMLHLQGYDHEKGDTAAETMENEERRILAGLGFPAPYGDEA